MMIMEDLFIFSLPNPSPTGFSVKWSFLGNVRTNNIRRMMGVVTFGRGTSWLQFETSFS